MLKSLVPFVSVCVLMPIAAHSQESLFQSSDGATSIYTQRSTATLNFGDSKASLAYSNHDNVHTVSQ